MSHSCLNVAGAASVTSGEMQTGHSALRPPHSVAALSQTAYEKFEIPREFLF